MNIPASEQVKLAKYSVEHYVKNNKPAPLPDISDQSLLTKRAGVFVTLKINGELRGCIGTIFPVKKTVAHEIIYNAISACSKDPRFSPVQQNELSFLEYSVDVLGEPEPVPDKSFLDVEKYGVIVTSGFRRGLLLPNLEGVDTVDCQLKIACMKAGIHEEEDYMIERFEVVRYT